MAVRKALAVAALALCLGLVACQDRPPDLVAEVGSGARQRRFETWSSLGQSAYQPLCLPDARGELPDAAMPWAGVISHHLLAGSLIDRWFSILAERRNVRTFYVLSPSHWGLGAGEFSLTGGFWAMESGAVYSDRVAVLRLAERLDVEFDDTVFDNEHGISTLMPYIARYFPKARVVALCYAGEPPVNMNMASRLAKALAPVFGPEGKRADFLLLSADFAHHGNLAGTVAKDERSWRFFREPGLSTWDLVGCDNRPGVFALASLGQEGLASTILYHTNSFELSGQDPSDITSYFFAYFYGP